jgi:hypothetical protein
MFTFVKSSNLIQGVHKIRHTKVYHSTNKLIFILLLMHFKVGFDFFQSKNTTVIWCISTLKFAVLPESSQ